MNENAVRSEPRELRAPSDDGVALMAPPPAEWDGLLVENRTIREGWHYDVQGRPLRELAAQARAELLRAALAYTCRYRDVPDAPDASAEFLLAGHQPELFHPGVWLKNFTLGVAARSRTAVALNLLIDNDTIKTTSLKIPTGTPETPRLVSIPFDRPAAAIPYEERRIADPELFHSFGARGVRTIRSLVSCPVLERLWPLARARAGASGNLGLSLAQARHILEGRWGLDTLELPQSQVCAAESFRWFAAHLLAHAPRFRHDYNEAVGRYRRRHGVRSAAHPAPDLATKDGWIETPFWIWTTADPRRRALFTALRSRRVVVSDRDSIEVELPLTPEGDGAAAVERLRTLEAGGLKIRSRALTTTLWARLALSDLFLHGIGGAKYDEVTDRLFECFLGLHPPRLMVVSGTLLLPVPAPEGSLERIRQTKQRLWQLRHHPERFLDERGEVPQDEHSVAGWLATEKRRWIETVQTAENARRRCRAIRALNVALQPYVARQRRGEADKLGELERAREASRVLRRRDFSFCLHPEDSLRHFLDRALFRPAPTCSNQPTLVR